MKKPILPPAQSPCGSCPYRRDVPSGVWALEEYEKLPEFDKPTAQQPPQVFMCHSADQHLCAGWVAVHNMPHSLGIRFALSMGLIRKEDVDAIFDYRTSTPLFLSGMEAARHGMRDLRHPKAKAVRTQRTFLARKKRKKNE